MFENPSKFISRVMAGSAALIFSRIAASACSFVLFWFISQRSVTDLGAFRCIFVYFIMAEFIPLLGMNHLIVRDVAQDGNKVDKMFFHSLIFSLLVTAFFSLALILTALFGNYSGTVSKGLMLVACAAPATAAVLCMQSCLIGKGQVVPIGIIQTAETIIRTTIGMILLLFSVNILGVFSVFVAARWMALIPYWKNLDPFLRGEKRAFHASFFKAFLKQVPVFFGLLTSYLAIRFGGQVILTWMAGDKEAGYYAAGSLFLDLILLIPTALTVNLMPIFAVTAKESMKHLKEKCYQAIRFITFILMPLLILATVKASDIINMIFGSEYAPAIPILQVAVWIGFIFSLDQIFSTAMIVLNRQKLDLLALASSAVLTLTALLLLISLYGAEGAIIGFFSGVSTLLILRVLVFSRFISRINPLPALARYFICGAVTMVFTYLLQIDFYAALFFVPMAYMAMVACSGGFSTVERNKIFEILRA